MIAAEDDPVVSLKEFIAEEDAREAEAMEVLPGRFDRCSYEQGYINQNIYVCVSCLVDDRPAAICYSCSIECHTNCKLIELMGRRGFRCDCGNSRFKTKCRLEPAKDTENSGNDYGRKSAHNFQGRFCSCDWKCPADGEEDASPPREMYQCLVCEDWYHRDCLEIPEEGEFSDFICTSCVKESEYLKHYECHVPCCVTNPTQTDCFKSLKPNWREHVCKCEACLHQIEAEGLKPLILEEPMIWEPEKDDAAPNGLDALKKDKVLLDTGLMAYEKLKCGFSRFVDEFAEKGHVITKQVKLLFVPRIILFLLGYHRFL